MRANTCASELEYINCERSIQTNGAGGFAMGFESPKKKSASTSQGGTRGEAGTEGSRKRGAVGAARVQIRRQRQSQPLGCERGHRICRACRYREPRRPRNHRLRTLSAAKHRCRGQRRGERGPDHTNGRQRLGCSRCRQGISGRRGRHARGAAIAPCRWRDGRRRRRSQRRRHRAASASSSDSGPSGSAVWSTTRPSRRNTTRSAIAGRCANH